MAAKAALEEKALRVVPQYMLEQNRPYSAIDVYTNLRQEYGKALIVKALEHGVSQELLKEKIISKQKIFYVNQDRLAASDEGALTELDADIARRSETFASLSAKYKIVQTELTALRSAETTAQLRATLLERTKVCSEMRERLALLSSARNSAGEEQGKRLMQAEDNMQAAHRKRKRIAGGMLNEIRESSNLPKKKLFEAIGLEIEDGEY